MAFSLAERLQKMHYVTFFPQVISRNPGGNSGVSVSTGLRNNTAAFPLLGSTVLIFWLMKNILVLDTIILILICGHSSKPPFIGLDVGFFLSAGGTLSSAFHACLVQAAFQGGRFL